MSGAVFACIIRIIVTSFRVSTATERMNFMPRFVISRNAKSRNSKGGKMSFDYDGPLNPSKATREGLRDGNNHWGKRAETSAVENGYNPGEQDYLDYCRAFVRSARSEMMT